MLDFFKATRGRWFTRSNEGRRGQELVRATTPHDHDVLSIEDLIGDMDQLAADLAKVLRARDEVTDKRA